MWILFKDIESFKVILFLHFHAYIKVIIFRSYLHLNLRSPFHLIKHEHSVLKSYWIRLKNSVLTKSKCFSLIQLFFEATFFHWLFEVHWLADSQWEIFATRFLRTLRKILTHKKVGLHLFLSLIDNLWKINCVLCLTGCLDNSYLHSYPF